MTACIIGSGAICAVGQGITQVAASVRTGLSGAAESAVYNRNGEPIVMALFPTDALVPLVPEVEQVALTPRYRRMLQLATPALLQATAPIPDVHRIPLLIALPAELVPQRALDSVPEPKLPPSREFLSLLSTQCKRRLDPTLSEVFYLGRAGSLIAVEKALTLLQTGQVETVIVGGVDTHLDLRLLARLDGERRLLGGAVTDGFIPGEGAAFVVLTTSRPRSRLVTEVVAAAGFNDPGHRYGQVAASGEGLSNALDVLRDKSNLLPICCTWAGFNGEHFAAKEWGVAQLRHRDLFDESMQLEHPADCYGDLGAATGAMMLALADHTIRQDTRPAPMLVWASSDLEPVACVYLTRADL